MRFKTIVRLGRDTVTEGLEDNVPLLAAALAYYTMFSLAPLLIIAIAIVGAIYGEDAARGEIVRQIQGLVGRDGAEFIQSMIQNASQPGSGGGVATLVGVVLLIFGASGVFGQLQAALNTIWEVKPKPGRAVKSFLQSRFLSFAMVLVIGFLLLVSLVLSAVFSGVSGYFGSFLPESFKVAQILDFAISLGLATLLFASIYKFLPDVKVPWKNLWVGSAVTALLFNVGKFLIGLYLGNSSVGSTYGAAGSLVVVLLWVFYSAQILLFGAEFTQVYSKYRGRPIEPSSHAVSVKEETIDSATERDQ
ncbi:MAG TPA: YihY/virulence factor BrkB family protein [Leptolyngbya sp.]|jgi:membrane protein|nr:YihY/virulence factor BrkB family protein [Leptolyngbya sp.]